MKRLINFSVFAIAALFLAFLTLAPASYAQDVEHGPNFVDENGDGYNDNAPDHDGDGIPNGQDDDYQPLNPDREKSNGFVDEDGDGINDRMQDADGDGIPNCEDEDWVKPQDGTGNKFGMSAGNKNGKGLKGNKGARGENFGECDGTGPKGKANGGSGNGAKQGGQGRKGQGVKN